MFNPNFLTLIPTHYLTLMLANAGLDRYDIEDELARRKNG